MEQHIIIINVLNGAVNQGMLVGTTGGSDFTSVNADAERELRVPATSTSTPPPMQPPPSAQANETTEVVLDLAQLQDFVEVSAAALTKILNLGWRRPGVFGQDPAERRKASEAGRGE